MNSKWNFIFFHFLGSCNRLLYLLILNMCLQECQHKWNPILVVGPFSGVLGDRLSGWLITAHMIGELLTIWFSLFIILSLFSRKYTDFCLYPTHLIICGKVNLRISMTCVISQNRNAIVFEDQFVASKQRCQRQQYRRHLGRHGRGYT